MTSPSLTKEYRYWYRHKRPERYLFDKSQMRARQKGLEFNLTPEWCAEQYAKGCAKTGLPFSTEVGSHKKANPLAPSVDRKDATRGYTMDNCQVVCWIYNCAKGTWTDEEVLKMAKALIAKESET